MKSCTQAPGRGDGNRPGFRWPAVAGAYVAAELSNSRTREVLATLAEKEVRLDGPAKEPIRITAPRLSAVRATFRFAGETFPHKVQVWEHDPIAVGARRRALRVAPVPPGRHDVVVTDGGDSAPSVPCELFRRRIDFRPGETMPLVIEIPPLGSIEGVVGGIPEEEAQHVWAYLVRGERRIACAQAGWNGRFTFPHVVPGSYRIRAAWFVGVGTGVDVEVRANETTRVEIEARDGSVCGTVKDESGKPIDAAYFVVHNELGEDQTFNVWPGGRFEILGLAEGPQLIRFAAPGYVPCRIPIEVKGDRTFDVVLRPGTLVTGEMVSSDGHRPLRDPEGWIFWTARDGTSGYAGRAVVRFRACVPADASSIRFEVEGRRPAEVRLEPRGEGFAPVRVELAPAEEGPP